MTVECVTPTRASKDFTLERLLRIFCTAPNAFWRHDVDISLAAAEKMARFAALAGVRVHFYLMLTSEHYNLLSVEGEHAIKVIEDEGHYIGLHCDLRGREPTAAVAHDWSLLTSAYPTITGSLTSFHRPTSDVLWRSFADFSNAYARNWKGRYISDSRRQFGPDKEALISDHMQINLHPEHWFA